jgi:hypothetical protein
MDSGRAKILKNRCCSISLMDIAVHNHSPRNHVVRLQSADCDRDVVDHAEAFAMIREGVVEASAEIDCDAVLKRLLCGNNRTAGVQPKSLHQFP